MPRKKKVIPEYGTCIRKGIEYYRTRIVDSDGKRVSLYWRLNGASMKAKLGNSRFALTFIASLNKS